MSEMELKILEELELFHEAAELAALFLQPGVLEPLVLAPDGAGFIRSFLEDLIGSGELEPAVESISMLASDLMEGGCVSASAALLETIVSDAIMKALLAVQILPSLHERPTQDKIGATTTGAAPLRRAAMHDEAAPRGAVKLRNLMPHRGAIR